ncbi:MULTISPECIES: MFS transporter [unclassified Streptomyces]|uniref:MFS transporter n=1 Tax=unclassified Streptomyces TaxID=2593676 RepID=UPI0033FE089C
MIVALDGTVLTVVQPALQRDLDASFAQVQWTSTGYLIAVASLLVFAGRLGDRYGHRRLFAVGTLGFAAASAGVGLASGIGAVIAWRVAQGVFGALLQPATLGMLRAAFPPDRLGTPIALRTSSIGLAAAAGPVLGAALATQLGWRSVFFISVVPALAIGVLALVVRGGVPAGRAAGPAGRDPGPAGRAAGPAPRLDLPGAGLLAVALACLVHTLVGVPESGWRATTVAGLVVACAAGAAFVRHERRTAGPLVPARLLRSPAVAPALGILVAASAATFGALFVATYFLQEVLELDPLHGALRGVPLAVTMIVGAPLSAVLLRRAGPRRTITGAMAVLAAGVLALSQLDRTSGPLTTGVAFTLVGAGFGTVMVAATAVVVRHAPESDAGVAGGLQQTAMNVGPALGIALATTLLTTLTSRTPTAGPGASHWSAEPFLAAMPTVLMSLAAVAAVGALVATRLPGLGGPGPGLVVQGAPAGPAKEGLPAPAEAPPGEATHG